MENIDKFNDFLDKYTKTGYISKRSKDLLDEFGIDKEVIDSLNKNINIARTFFKNQNFEILRELLYDITDFYPILSYDYGDGTGKEEQIYYKSNLKINASTCKKYGRDITIDLRYLESYPMFKDIWISNAEVIKTIIDLIDKKNKKELLSYSDTYDKFTPKKDSREREGIRWGNKSSFYYYLKKNYYKSISIKPEIIINAYFAIDPNYNLDEKNKMVNFIKNNLTNYIIPVYLDMIKCPYKFTVNDFYISYSCSCDIKITLDI